MSPDLMIKALSALFRQLDDKGWRGVASRMSYHVTSAVLSQGENMADITKRPFLSHFRGSPTTHVVHVKRGKTAHEGTGQAFWFRPLTAVLAEVPVDDRELPMLFHARTKDFQDVT